MESADVTDDGPGKGKIFILFSIHSFTKIDPGSDTPGVPASEIREIIVPFFNKFKTFNRFFFSLNLWFEINFDFISYFCNKIFDVLVSSHNI